MAHNQFYPRIMQISEISNDVQALVSFNENHDFTPGEIVSFRIGKAFGMYEINNLQAKVLLISADDITIDINTSTWNPFTLVNLNQPGTSPPICIPSASSAIPFQENPSVNIEDAFDNRRI